MMSDRFVSFSHLVCDQPLLPWIGQSLRRLATKRGMASVGPSLPALQHVVGPLPPGASAVSWESERLLWICEGDLEGE